VPRPPARIVSIQACRGIAASLVIFAHNSVSIFSRPKYWPSNPVGHWLDWTHVGVELFFVISGFIIAEVHAKDIGHPNRIPAFLRKRFLRIYPLYWIILAFLLVLYFAKPSFGEGFERLPAYIASSATLIDWLPLSPTRQPVTILPVAWSLYHEILFYAAFMALLFSRRFGALVLTTWFAACIVNLLFGPFGGMAGLYIAPRNLVFAMGLFAAWALRRGRIPAPALCLALGLLLFFGAAIQEVTPHILSEPVESLTCGLGAMLALLGLVELERTHHLRTPKFLVSLGDASYSIYLIHLPVLIFTAKLVIPLRAHLHLPLAIWYALFFCVALAAGFAVHYALEKPLLRLLHSKPAGGQAYKASAGAPPLDPAGA
jgi:peptidoglycan/LPS O-acetylase OafA/YrhL